MLAAATKAFARNGFTATGLDDIAAEARVILYRHFDSKTGLYQAVLDRFCAVLGDHVAQPVGGFTDASIDGGAQGRCRRAGRFPAAALSRAVTTIWYGRGAGLEPPCFVGGVHGVDQGSQAGVYAVVPRRQQWWSWSESRPRSPPGVRLRAEFDARFPRLLPVLVPLIQ
ncbi:TetR/AcrR family transcriptional regulator [Jidongwangia harbinensis]|uniref:TetR/AcrR family transcriptional regulator n=1 Tax=Jidongwangia harbinensis TaxID=2878561 RepID=UPI001CD9B310|nr:helix-turn-helix domain-containing protein [Jidongwangia harbinensis]MCA2219436.1 TetR/AcrR family transcriptional regulator [Jidongwangia harbinensis]